MTRAVGAHGGLQPGSIGMRQALSEVLECAAPGGRAGGGGGGAVAQGPGADVG